MRVYTVLMYIYSDHMIKTDLTMDMWSLESLGVPRSRGLGDVYKRQIYVYV